MSNPKSKRSALYKALSFYLFLVFLAFLRAVASYVFLVPNGFAPGGVSGLATVIYKGVQSANASLAETVFNPAITVYVINIPLLIISFKFLSKKFAINTLITVTAYSLFMGLFSLVKMPYFAEEPSSLTSTICILASIVGGVLAGIGLGFMLRNNASMGGTDVVGKLIYKKNAAIDPQWGIFACDIVIVLTSGILGVIGINTEMDGNTILIAILTPIVYSAISLFITSEVAEVITGGMQHSRVCQIITDNVEELSQAILDELKRGGSIISVKGIYTNLEHKMLMVVIPKKQINTMKKIVKRIDPKSFMIISKAAEIKGFGFTPNTTEED